ncbi:MAG: hypothetical protein IPK59_07660 [Rhodospirillaceae bacterium]|nr:hypothetical protein [Rhodospirillaceae bacterium]
MKRRAFAALAQAMPTGSRLLLLIEKTTIGLGEAWAAQLKLSCDLRVVPVQGTMRDVDLWIQDPLLVAEHNGLPLLLPLQDTDHAGQHAKWLTQAGCRLGLAPPLHLTGGNMLTGKNFRLVGASSIENTKRIGDRPVTIEEALAGHAALDARPVHVFGFNLPRRGDKPGLAQQPHHLDLVVSLTGIDTADGRPVLFVADPRKTLDPDGPRMVGWAEQLDASVDRLTADGFAVLRNKVPYLPHPIYAPNPMLRAYNNVIVENDIRFEQGKSRPLVWMPQFGDLEPELALYDSANRLAWEELGFESIPVYGWSAMTRAGGALRCASKVLTRR